METGWPVLFVAIFIAVVVAIVVWPEVIDKPRARWPGIFETDMPNTDEMPPIYMLYTIGALLGIIGVGMRYGGGWAIATFILLFLVGVVLMHGVPYVRHQWRRLRPK